MIQEYAELLATPDGWRQLAGAVILMAVEDYREAAAVLRRNPDHLLAAKRMRSCEAFFRSRWFGCLTELDGRQLLAGLRKETSRESA